MITKEEIKKGLYGLDCEYVPQLNDAVEKVKGWINETIEECAKHSDTCNCGGGLATPHDEDCASIQVPLEIRKLKIED